MQACEGYVKNGSFYLIGFTLPTLGRLRAFLTILDEPARDEDIVRRLAALDRFFEEIEASDEPVPEFERVAFGVQEI